MRIIDSLLIFFRERWKLIVLYNLVFFGFVFVFTILAESLLSPVLDSDRFLPVSEPSLATWVEMLLATFVFNLIVSAFAVVTLPGFAFFPLSLFFLAFRAFSWGLLIYPLPSSLFLVALPTMLLEGEAYVFSAAGGTLVGVSWVRPEWFFPGEVLSRAEAFKKALKDCLRLYIVVVFLLLVAAFVEITTILYINV